MKRILSLAFLAIALTVSAAVYRYDFRSVPLSQALVTISKDHPEIDIIFIYNQLEDYNVSATIDTDSPDEAMRTLIARIPVSMTVSGRRYIFEALQEGLFCYHGRAVDRQSQPVPYATVMLLSPADSTVITYGTTLADGLFRIPCDSREVIAKLSSIGYKSAYRHCRQFAVGDIVMEVNPIQVGSVTVNADETMLLPDKSVFVPQTRHKRASQTGYELLNRMAIPQLSHNEGEGVRTVSGQDVAVYIDSVPASPNDIKGMRISDVLRVEYYDYPSDPYFVGNAHVVNFITVQYNYGGYVKANGIENYFGGTGGQASLNGKLQIRRMTYDIGGGAFYRDCDHGVGSDQTETFRLPQPDGTLKVFDRHSQTLSSRDKTNSFWATAKATYRSHNAMVTNMVSVDSWDHPEADQTGKVTYSPEIMETSQYTNRVSDNNRSVIYDGDMVFTLPRGNSLSLSPRYANTHTTQNFLYTEGDLTPIASYATDNTNQVQMLVSYTHDFGRAGSITPIAFYRFTGNRIRYSGTVDKFDRANTSLFNTGINYSFKTKKLYTLIGLGWIWNRFGLNDIRETSSKPWADLSMNYAFSGKSSANITFHYSTWPAEANLKSETILQSSPLMYYTGNPSLNPIKSYDIWGQYILLPTSRLKLSAFGYAWIVGNRYAYFYEARPESILRTIRQPIGSFASVSYGANASLSLFDSSLQLSGSLSQCYVSDTAPFDYSRFSLSGSLEASYYHGNFYYGACYTSDSSKARSSMSGIWTTQKGFWWLQAGWGNDNLNIRIFLKNLDRWGWRGNREILNTENYSMRRRELTTSNHALFQITATYTFGFGKKVERGNEASQLQGAGSAILQ